MSESNLWRRFEALVKPVYIVAIFVLLLLFGLYREGEAAEVDFGPTFLSGEYSQSAMILLNEVWNDKWVLGMGIVGPQKVVDRHNREYEVRTNLFIHGQRRVHLTDDWTLGVGMAYFNAITRWNGSHVVASLSVEYDVGEDGGFGLKYRHWSNAGSASPNMGQDAFLITYTF